MKKKKIIILSIMITFTLSIFLISLNKSVSAATAGGQGGGDCWGNDIFTDAATENVTTKNIVKETSAQKISVVSVGTVKIKKAVIHKKTVKIKLKKVKGASGYTIKFSTSNKFSKARTKTVKTKKINYVFKKIKTSKRYYIKARAYIKRNKKNYYGNWSKVKIIKRKLK